MRKRSRKLGLNRETLCLLQAGQLGQAAGGSEVPGLCDPSGDSQYETACYVCPLRPPTIEN
jgi:hypothetical protein